MNQMIKILIFDPSPIFTFGIKLLVEREKNLLVTGILNKPQEIITQTALLSPDLFIYSSFHNGDDLSLLRKIRHHYPGLPLLVVVCRNTAYLSDQLAELKVEGIAGSEITPGKFVEAIHQVGNGKKYYSDEIREKHFPDLKNQANGKNENELHLAKLSKREIEILRKLTAGLTHKEIADQLFISHRTVETHRNKIISKLHLRTTADLIKLGYELNLV